MIAPIRSRCICLRVSAPTHAQICHVLCELGRKEGIKIPNELAVRISHVSGAIPRILLPVRALYRAFKYSNDIPLIITSSHACSLQSSDRNLRRAILTLEACKIQQSPLTEKQSIQLPDWQLFVSAMCDDVLQEQSPKQLLKVCPAASYSFATLQCCA